MNFVKVLSTSIDDLSRRVVKFLRLGRDDVQTSLEVMPFGVDSVPTKDLVALYAQTEEKGKTVIIGYLNKNQLAEIGEYRIYSANEDGEEQTYIYLKNDGTQEIGGNTDFMVRYTALETAFDDLKAEHDDLVGAFNELAQEVKTFATAYAPGGPVTLGTPPVFSVTNQNEPTSSADITPSKIEEIKTI